MDQRPRRTRQLTLNGSFSHFFNVLNYFIDEVIIVISSKEKIFSSFLFEFFQTFETMGKEREEKDAS